MIIKPLNDHLKFVTDLTIITKSNVSEIGPWSTDHIKSPQHEVQKSIQSLEQRLTNYVSL